MMARPVLVYSPLSSSSISLNPVICAPTSSVFLGQKHSTSSLQSSWSTCGNANLSQAILDGHHVATSSNLLSIFRFMPPRSCVGMFSHSTGQHRQTMPRGTCVPVAFKNISTSLLILGTLTPFSVIHLLPTEASAMHCRAHTQAFTHNCLSSSSLLSCSQ